jgi:hypothetical protein
MTLRKSTLIPEIGDPKVPFPENTPCIDDLLSMPTAEVAALPIEILAVLQHEIDAAAGQIKSLKSRFEGALVARYTDRAAEERQASGKDTGTVRFDDGDVTIVADLPKRIDWDQTKLAAMVARISAAGDDPAQYVDITYKVPERKYTAWPDAIRERFTPARTVRTGKLSVTLIPAEEEK